MTAPDVRTAARQEAFTNLYSHKKVPDRYDADLLIAGFMDGAVWGAALVTPTREQLVAVPKSKFTEAERPWLVESPVVFADAVLALLQELRE